MAKRSFRQFVEQELGKLPFFVIYAVLEWVLIFVLFVDGFLAFFANEFARFFELKTPCLLCTRIDHVLVRRNPDFYYNDSICEAHKKDVSSLAYCHVHRKLSDIRKLCDACLLSFATERESDCDTYKSLVGILHKDIELFVDDYRELHFALPAARKEEEMQAERSSSNQCACCGDSVRVKSFNPRAKHLNHLVSHGPTPSPRAPLAALRHRESRNMELSHIRYTELKLSDNESEINDDDDGSNTLHISKQLRDDVKAAAAAPLLAEAEDMNEDRTPTISRGNKFFGIPLTDSANMTPRLGGARSSRKSPLERTEYASDCAEGSMQNEPEGDWVLQHLKRQFRLDHKSLMALYMELDEERSASAVAANNAMAMITRLQAEKAAVQMEALQYQRMMEEQAEYDEEILQATRDMLLKREEEIKVLEAELDAYREKYGYLREEGFEGSEDDNLVESYHDMRSQSHLSLTEASECFSPNFSISTNDQNEPNEDQAMSLGDEQKVSTPDKSLKCSQRLKSANLRRLKNLDKKMQISSDDGPHSSKSSSEYANHIDEESEQDNKARFMRGLIQLQDQVKTLKAGENDERSGERKHLLTEISDDLQKIRQALC